MELVMDAETFVILICVGFTSALIMNIWSEWWTSRLRAWAKIESAWLAAEERELTKMHHFMLEQHSWETRRTYYGNPLMLSAYNNRVVEYELRRKQYVKVLERIKRRAPW